MDKKVNNKTIALIMFAALLALYNIIIFLLVGEKNNVFWFNYVIFTLFYLFFVVCSIFLFSLKDIKVRFFGITLFAFSIYFLLSELFLSSILIAFRNKVGIKWSIILQALLIVLYVTIFSISIMAVNYSHSVSEKYAKKVVDMKLIAFDVSKIINRTNDEKLKSKLRELSEILKYSDPIGTDVVSDINEEIKIKVERINNNINNVSQQESIALIDETIVLCKERNEKLKISKM